MPILSPSQIQNVLKETKLGSQETADLLLSSGLAKEDVINCLSEIMRGADNSQTRLRAAEIAMKLHGMLKGDEAVNAPVVNIIIKDSPTEVNPILMVR